MPAQVVQLRPGEEGKGAELISLDKIRLDGGTQSRERLNKDRVAQFAEQLSELPPVVVFNDGEHHWLAAGFHRVAAFASKDRKKIPAHIRKGSLDDAKWYAAASNKDGDRSTLYRSPADKRKDVLLALSTEKSKSESARLIAEHVGVSDRFVRMIKSEVRTVRTCEGNHSESRERVTGKDGKQYPAKNPKQTANTEPVDLEWTCIKCGTVFPAPQDECPHCAPAPVDDEAANEETSGNCPGCGLSPNIGCVCELESADSELEENSGTLRAADVDQETAARVLNGQIDLAMGMLRSLEELRQQRDRDPDLRMLRAAQEAVSKSLPSKAQRMVTFILDGGELALLRLGLDWTVDAEKLKAAYRQAAAKAHPDRGGNAYAFARLTEARDLVAKYLEGS